MLPRGMQIELLAKTQVDFATAAIGNYTRTFAYEASLMEKAALEDDPLLGQPRHNDRDTLGSVLGLPAHDGQIVVPLCLNHLGFWLVSLFGLPSTSGIDPDYEHVFNSGAETIPYRTVEIKVAAEGGDRFMQHTGIIANRMTLELSRAANFQRVTIDTLGRQETKLPTSAGGTPEAPWALARLLAATGVLKIDAVTPADLLSINATYDNKLQGLEFAGSNYVSGYDTDEAATFTGTMRVRFKDFAHYDRAVASTPAALEFLWQTSATRQFSLAAPVVKFERQGVEIRGPGGIEQSFNFRAEQSPSAPTLTATLRNEVPAYA